jgi:hypothetical protein
MLSLGSATAATGYTNYETALICLESLLKEQNDGGQAGRTRAQTRLHPCSTKRRDAVEIRAKKYSQLSKCQPRG